MTFSAYGPPSQWRCASKEGHFSSKTRVALLYIEIKSIFLPDNFGAFWSRKIDGTSTLNVVLAVVVVLEDEDEVPGRHDPARAGLRRDLI